MEYNDNTTNGSRFQSTRRESLLVQPEPDPFHRQPQEEPPLSSTPTVDAFPNVFDEAKDMLLSAILIYGMVDLRQLARHDLLDEETSTTTTYNSTAKGDECLQEQLLALPISAKDVVRLVARHRSKIERHVGKDATSLYLDAFDAIQSTCSSRELELEFNRGRVSLVDFSVVAVCDEHLEDELVYAICVDTARRRITLLFRGCSTRKDWSICANNILKEQVNPLYHNNSNGSSNNLHPTTTIGDNISINQQEQQPPTIAIHSGYCNYLFAANQTDGKSKFASIISKLKRLLSQYPGYQVYVTGHSLGAALATVFSFHAAATQALVNVDDRDGGSSSSYVTMGDEEPQQQQQQQPITCINFASPMVGNLAFETAFRTLEADGKVRCLRVTNHFDIFTQLPDRGNWLYVVVCCWGLHLIWYVGWSLLFFLCFQTHVYRHVGMDLHMYKHRHYNFNVFSRNKNNNGNSQRNNKDNNERAFIYQSYAYKVKHSRGTSKNFAWRVAQDWKKHFKQALQRLMMVPFVVNFNTNHSAQEHLQRLTALAEELEGVTLKDLYDTKRFPSATTTSPPTSPLAAAIADSSCFV